MNDGPTQLGRPASGPRELFATGAAGSVAGGDAADDGAAVPDDSGESASSGLLDLVSDGLFEDSPDVVADGGAEVELVGAAPGPVAAGVDDWPPPAPGERVGAEVG